MVGGGHQIGSSDLLGGQPADLAQGQGDARVRREGRVTAGEDQAQLVVLDVLEHGRLRLLLCPHQKLGQSPESRACRRRRSTALKRPVETSQE